MMKGLVLVLILAAGLASAQMRNESDLDVLKRCVKLGIETLPAKSGHGVKFPYTSSIFSVYVLVENVWTPLSVSISRLLQR